MHKLAALSAVVVAFGLLWWLWSARDVTTAPEPVAVQPAAVATPEPTAAAVATPAEQPAPKAV